MPTGHTAPYFADLILVGERVEDGIKSGKIVDVCRFAIFVERAV